jgi:hypothetical protein
MMAAELSGEVADVQGRAMAGVSVRAIQAGTGAAFATETNDAGVYRLAALPVGRYALMYAKAGFRSVEMGAVELHVGEERKADVRLAVEEQAYAVTVTETDSAVARAVLKEEIQNLPLNGRQLQNLALLAPGVAAGWNWSTAANRYGKARENLEGAFNVNGARGRSNNFSLDGITFNLRQYGVINFEPSVEAVEEFRMVTGTAAAEYGGTMGPSIAMVTRSGGDAFHGSVYEFLRNDVLDATDTFNRRAGLPKGKLRQNQFGGSAGGPLYGRRHFFFGNAEFLRIIEGVETRRTSVPTAEEARGLLRYREGGVERTVDLGSRINGVSRNLLGLYPAPNAAGGADGLNYNSSLLIRLNDYQTHGRTDHYLTERDVVNVRVSWNRNDQEYVINRFGGPYIPGFSLPNPEKTINGGVGYTRTAGPAVVNEFRVGVNRYANPLANGDRRSAEEIGLPNGSVANGIPSVVFRGGTLEPLGGLGWFNRDQNETTYQVGDSLSVLAGRHSLKVGGGVLRQHFNTRGAFNQRGTVVFDGSRNPVIPRIPGNERASLLADFLLGLPAEASITVGQFGRGYRQWTWSGFAQDSWRATGALTVHLGVRYDYSAPWTEVNGKLWNLGGRWYRPDRNNFGPRAGFAYERGKTVIRGGFGVQYETLLQTNSVELVENNAPYSASAITRTPAAFGARATTLLDLAGQAAPSRSIGAVGSFRNPYTMQFSLGLQRPLGAGWTMEAGYTGSRGVALPVYRGGNQVPLAALTMEQRAAIGAAGRDTAAVLQPLRPYPEFDGITLSENIGSSVYHSGQLRLRRSLQGGVMVEAGYTWAKSIDNASDFNSGDASEQVLDAYNLGGQRAVSSFDVAHRLTATGQWALPGLLRGWTVNGLLTLQTGQPFTPFYPTLDPFRNESFNRPDVVGDAGAGVPAGFAFNPKAFAAPALGTFGNAGRNIIRGDAFGSLDMSVFRTFRIGERVTAQLRGELVNSLNTVNYQGPVVNLTGAAGAFVAAAPPRVAQMGVRVGF